MLEKLSKYTFEIIAGIAIFVAIVYFLPSNKVEIPDIGELALSGVALDFVMDEEVLEEEIILEQEIVAIDTWVVETWTVDTWMIAFEPVQEPIVTGTTTTEILPIVVGGKDSEPTVSPEPIIISQKICALPRWWTINHGASVLAYQQRSDDPATCNIQRRVCSDGTLNWSYTQLSCKEVIGYTYTEDQKVVAYNVPNKNDPYIQPTSTNNSNMPTNNTSKTYNRFNPSVSPIAWDNTNHTYNDFTPSVSPTWQWGGWSSTTSPVRTSQSPSPIITNTSSSTTRDGTVCQTPWGENVRNGQFVKAYRFDKGFSNLPCEVELRYCVQTNLEWSFAYASCQPYDIAVEDYMIGHNDPNEPSITQLMEILHQSADIEPLPSENQTWWEKIQGFIKNIFN